MRLITLALAAAASVLLVIAAPGQAADPPNLAQLEAMSDKELDKRFRKVSESSEDHLKVHCLMAPYLAEYRRRRGTPDLDHLLALSTGFCAFGEDRYAEAIAQLEQAEAQSPDDIEPETRRGIDTVLVVAATLGKDPAALEAHSLHVARRNWPEEFRAQSDELWPFALRELDLPAKGRVALEFARASAFAHLPKDLQGLMAYLAVRPALASGDGELGARLALRDPSASSVLSLLIDRDYEPIWPQLTAASGPHMRLLLDADLAEARSEAGASPDDFEKQALLANALLASRDPAGVVALAARIDHSPEGIAKVGEDQGWVLNAEVEALDRLGRQAEADVVFERLGPLAPEPGRGWIVNFAINRAARLVDQQRWAEALQPAELAVEVAAKHGSPYAKEAAAVNRYCAAVKHDPQRKELDAWWAEIEEKWADAVGAAINVAHCRGDRARARKFIRDGLEKPDTRSAVLARLQRPAFSLYSHSANTLEEPRALLDGDPELKSLYLKYGRDLPDELMPK